MAFTLKPRVSRKRFPGLQFNLVINGLEKDLTGATVNLLLNDKVVFSTTTGTLIFSDRTHGKVQLPAQVLNLPPANYHVELKYLFADGTDTSGDGYWLITPK